MSKQILKKFSLVLIFSGAVLFFAGCNRDAVSEEISGPPVDALEMASLVDGLMEELFSENQDHYATYFTPAEYLDIYGQYMGSFGGIGVYMQRGKDDPYPVIVGVMEGYPAERGGVLPGDLIISIDGESAFEMEIDMVAQKVKGEVGSSVRLEIRHEANALQGFIDIQRELIETKTVTGSILSDEEGIAYIAISNFTSLTAGEFADIYNSLNSQARINSLILDLRNNGGGSVESAVDVASYFVPAGEVVFWQKKGGRLLKATATKTAKLDIPVVCLQNENSASASEMLIGALKDHGLAATVGKLSFGKGITQIIYQLDSGAGLRYTESKYFTPDMWDLHEVGIEPQIEVDGKEGYFPKTSSPDLVDDLQLIRALELLTEE